MCRRFTTVPVNATGFSNDFGFEAAGQQTGPVPGGMPKGTTTHVGHWHLADIAVGLAHVVTVGGTTDERQLSVLTLGVEAL